MNMLSASGSKFGTAMLSAGKVAAIGVGIAGVAIAGFAAAGVKAYGSFEDKLNQSLAIMGNVGPEMRAQMEDTARSIAKSTRFGADQAAEAYYFLASAGLDAQQSVAAMPQVAAFAQAGMFDLSRATALLADAQSALGMKSKDAQKNLAGMTRVSDVLVKANTLANASVQQFSEALTNKAGAALKVVGKDVEEGVAVLAAFADQGIKGARAGTALGIVFRDLQTKAIKNKDAFKEVGVSVYDSSGEMRNMGDIIADLEGALAGMSDEQKKATLTQLGFADRSIIYIQTLLGTSDAIKGYEASLRKAGGTTKEVADKQLESINAQFDLLKSNVADTMIGLGKELAPTIKDELMPALKDMATLFAGFVQMIAPAVIKSVSLLVDSFTGLKWITEGIAESLGLGEKGAADLTLITRELTRGTLSHRDAATNLADALWALGKRTGLTSESMDVLTAASGANSKEIEAALRVVIDYAYAQDQVTDSTRAMEQKLYDVTMANREQTWAMAVATQGADALGVQSQILGDDLGDLQTDTEDLTDATDDATTAQENLASALQKQVSPVFNAIEALKKHKALLKKIDKDGKRTVDEQLEFVKSLIDTQVALSDIDPEAMRTAMAVVQDALGMTRAEAQGFFDDLELLDGKKVRVVYDIQGSPQVNLPPSLLGHGFGIINTPRFHDGGVYHAPMPGGQGLALLQDGEVVSKRGQTSGDQVGGITIQSMNITVQDDLRDPGAGRRFVERLYAELENYKRERV